MTKTPWQLWLVAILSLLWNAGGGFDYVMIRTGNSAYLDQMTPEQIAYVGEFPIWVSIAWALGVWGALAGSVLLLLRSRHALWAFILSGIGIAGNLAWGLFISPTPMSTLGGPGAMWFTFAIVIVALFLIYYAARLNTRGVLR